MNKTGLNHCFRVVWNATKGAWQVTSEIGARAKKSKASKASVSVASVLIGLTMPMMGFAAPTGGAVTQGVATISNAGTTTTINQTSQNTSINWDSFGIATGEAVNFAQPNALSLAVNRVIGANPSAIFGSLTANGQIYLINPNGVLFGQGATVNVGGLVASTLNIDTTHGFGGSSQVFSGNSTAGVSVANGASLNGKYVALIGPVVSNSGAITASNGGTVAFGAGDKVTLTFADNNLLNLKVDASAVNGMLSASNSGTITANGGLVVMSAQAASNLMSSVVNNTGVIQANTVSNVDGKIVLSATGSNSTTQVGGTLNTGARHGSITTAGDAVHINAGADVATGQWQIDSTSAANTVNIDHAAASAIGAALDKGTAVGVSSGQDIVVASSISQTGHSQGNSHPDTALVLKADGNLTVNNNQAIGTAGADKMDITLSAASAGGEGSITLKSGSSLSSNGGDIRLGGGKSYADLTGDAADPTTNFGIGYASSSIGDGVSLTNSSINSAGGRVVVNGTSSHTGGAGVDIAQTGNKTQSISTGKGDLIVSGIGTGQAEGIALHVANNDNLSFATTHGVIYLDGRSSDLNPVHAIAGLATSRTGNKVLFKADSASDIFVSPNLQSFKEQMEAACGCHYTDDVVKLTFKQLGNHSQISRFVDYDVKKSHSGPGTLIRVGDVQKTYDGTRAVPSVNAYVISNDGTPVERQDVDFKLNAHGKNVGTYSLRPKLNECVGQTVLDGDLTITPKALTVVSIDSGSNVYGDPVHPGATSLSGIVSGDTVNASTDIVGDAYSSSGNLVVGHYDQSLKAITGGDAGNYTVSNPDFVNLVSYSVTPKSLGLATIASVETTYGTPADAGAVTLGAGVISGDVVGGGTATIDNQSFSTSGNLKAATYDQSASGGLTGGDAGNYTFTGTVAPHSYVVDPKALASASIAPVETTYGTPADAGAVTLGSDVISGDVVSGGTATIDNQSFSTSGNLKAATYDQSASGGLTGGDAGNYTFTGTVAPHSYVVDPKALASASIASVETTYGTPADAGAVTLGSDLIAGDLATAEGAIISNAAYSTSNNLKAGTYDQIAAGVLTGADASNYTLSAATQTASYVVDQKAISSANIASVETTYGTPAPTGAVNLGTSVISSDLVQASQTATVVDPHTSTSGNLKAATYDQTVAGGLTGADASNYTFTGTVAPHSYVVDPKALASASIASVETTYGTPAAAGAVTLGSDVVSGDLVTGGTAVIDNQTFSTSGNLKAATYDQSATGGLTGADAGNYIFTGTTAPHSYVVDPKAITSAIIASVETTYGTFAETGAITLDGDVIAGDVVTAGKPIINNAVYSTSNQLRAGTYDQTTAAAGLLGADASNYTLASTTTPNSYVVDQRAITSASIAAVDTTYGTPAAAGAVSLGTSVISSDLVNASQLATVVDPQTSTSGNLKAATYDQHVAGGLTGVDSANYTFTGATQTGNYMVDPKAIASATIAAVETTYGTPAPAGAVTLGAGVISGDLVSGGTATINNQTFSTSGNLKAATYDQSATGGLTGADASNYSFFGTTAPHSYVVDPKALTTASIAAVQATYGTSAPTGSITLGSDQISGDQVSAGLPIINNVVYSTSNHIKVGTYNQTSAAGGLIGADASNYSFSGVTQPASYTVAKLDVQANAVVNNKTYDATTNATLGSASVAGLAGDVLAVDASAATASFVDKNAGPAKPVTVSGLTLTGFDSSNYNLLQPTGLAATINQLVAFYTATPATLPAGGTIPATFAGVISGILANDTSPGLVGAPVFTTPATSASLPGQYAINGAGLTSQNYTFVQAPANATALTLTQGQSSQSSFSSPGNQGVDELLLNTNRPNPDASVILNIRQTPAPASSADVDRPVFSGLVGRMIGDDPTSRITRIYNPQKPTLDVVGSGAN